MTDVGYSYKKLQDGEHVELQDLPPLPSSPGTARADHSAPQYLNIFDRNPRITSWAVKMLVACLVLVSALSFSRAAILEKKQAASTASSSTTRVPQYFQTTPELFTGMCASHNAKASPRSLTGNKVPLQQALRPSWPRAILLPSEPPPSSQINRLRRRSQSWETLRMRVSSS